MAVKEHMTIELPQYVVTIIHTLKRAGYQGYAVGGCVRDALMGRTPNDYDVTTDALPEQVRTLFEHTIATGERFGTITVVIGKNSVEVTTFRIDGEYHDNRRPALVTHAARVSDDLARRDFTVNAICYNPEDGLYDPYHGAEDITAGLIRAVGLPDVRFREDALRILRGVRFCASLGFEAENATLLSMIENARLLQHISGERIRDEVVKTIMTDRPDMLNIILMAEGLSHVGLTASERILQLAALPQLLCERLAALFVLCARDLSFTLEALRFSNQEKKEIHSITDALGKQMIADTIHLKRLLQNHSVAELLSAARVKQALYNDDTVLDCVEEIRRIETSNEPYRITHLAVNGNDILALKLFEPWMVGRVLSFLLDCCIGNPFLNERETLLALAQSYSE